MGDFLKNCSILRIYEHYQLFSGFVWGHANKYEAWYTWYSSTTMIPCRSLPMQVQSDHKNTICVWFDLNKPSLERKSYDSNSHAAIFLGTIHLRRRQIFMIFDPSSPTIGIPAKCLWRGFLILMYCDLLTIGTWGHPPPTTCWRLRWMVTMYIKMVPYYIST